MVNKFKESIAADIEKMPAAEDLEETEEQFQQAPLEEEGPADLAEQEEEPTDLAEQEEEPTDGVEQEEANEEGTFYTFISIKST